MQRLTRWAEGARAPRTAVAEASQAPAVLRGLQPGTQVPAECRPPGSKSLAIRALLCAALAEGETRLTSLPEGQDVEACLEVLRASGVRVAVEQNGALRVTGRSVAQGQSWNVGGALPCGESGTLARFCTAIYAYCGDPEREHRIEVSGSLRARSSGPLFAALAETGVGLRSENEGWPLRVRPARPPQTMMLQNPCSSQELSALLLALAAHTADPRGRSVLVMGGLPSAPYASMTASMLEVFGAEVQATGAEWRVRGPLRAPAESVVVETDASAAAVALAAGCLQDQEVRVAGFRESSWQGDVRILSHLEAFGCEVQRAPDALIASGFPRRAVDLDLSQTPDLAPVLAALAGALSLRLGPAAPPSLLRGLETLNGKESRRVEVLAAGLRRLGIDVQGTESSLRVGASRGLQAGREEVCVLDPEGDHRMAFAFALLGLVREAVWVKNPDCVRKSWPAFWDALGAASRPA